MLPIGVLLVFVLTPVPTLSIFGSHSGHGHGKPWGPIKPPPPPPPPPRPPHRPTAEPCCGFYCADGHHCKVTELCGQAACFPDNPCPALACTDDQQCVVPPTGDAECQTIDPCSDKTCCDEAICLNVEGEATCFASCFYDHDEFEHGEVEVDDSVNAGCNSLKCSDGVMKLFLAVEKGNDCVGEFKPFQGGCYLLVEDSKTWCEARKDCQDKGGDLAAGNYATLQAFLDDEYGDSHYRAWVGIRRFLWLTGRAVTEWVSGEPDNGIDACGRMKPPDGLRVEDEPCTTVHPYVCQLY